MAGRSDTRHSLQDVVPDAGLVERSPASSVQDVGVHDVGVSHTLMTFRSIIRHASCAVSGPPGRRHGCAAHIAYT